MKLRIGLLLSLLLPACSGGPGSMDAGLGDSGPTVDAGSEPDLGATDLGPTDQGAADQGAADLGVADQGTPDLGATDLGPADAGPPAPGFGEISGMCGMLSGELGAPGPSWFVNAIDFRMDPYDPGDAALLTDGSRAIIQAGNKNPGSLLSEVFAYEVMARCEGALLLKTEREVSYENPMGKKTDLLVEIDGQRVGVSVTRAVGFPRDAPYTEMQARTLLEEKLGDILLSSANVRAKDRWVKQVLHVIAWGPDHVDSLLAARNQLDAMTLSDTVIVVTVSDGDDEFLY